MKPRPPTPLPSSSPSSSSSRSDPQSYSHSITTFPRQHHDHPQPSSPRRPLRTGTTRSSVDHSSRTITSRTHFLATAATTCEGGNSGHQSHTRLNTRPLLKGAASHARLETLTTHPPLRDWISPRTTNHLHLHQRTSGSIPSTLLTSFIAWTSCWTCKSSTREIYSVGGVEQALLHDEHSERLRHSP